MTNKLQNSIKNSSQDEDTQLAIEEKYLGFRSDITTLQTITVPIDEEIKESSYYRHVVTAIEDLTENDLVKFNITSPGGLYSGLVSILSALNKTEATSIACINGECSSAASMLALHCDMIDVSPFAEMLVHYFSYGTGGPANHVAKKSEHVHKVSEKFFRDTYKYFLTEEEIKRCIEDDYQLWLDSDQIMERLEQREALIEENEAQLAQENPENNLVLDEDELPTVDLH